MLTRSSGEGHTLEATALHAENLNTSQDALDVSLSGRGSPASRRQTAEGQRPRGARSMGGPG